jgi:hypothetical protein
LAAKKPFDIALKPVGVEEKDFRFGLYAFLTATQGVFGGLNVCEFKNRSQACDSAILLHAKRR